MRRRLDIAGIVLAALALISLPMSLRGDEPSRSGDSCTANAAAVQRTQDTAAGKDFIAELQARARPQDSDSDPPVYVTALSFVSKLALVIALAYLTILGLKRLTAARGRVEGIVRSLKVLESLSIGANRTLHLVEAGKRRFLLASTPSQVSLIAEFSGDEIEPHTTDEWPSGFGDHLKAFLGFRPHGQKAAESVAQMLRDSGSYLLEKAADIGRLRNRHGSTNDK